MSISNNCVYHSLLLERYYHVFKVSGRERGKGLNVSLAESNSKRQASNIWMNSLPELHCSSKKQSRGFRSDGDLHFTKYSVILAEDAGEFISFLSGRLSTLKQTLQSRERWISNERDSSARHLKCSNSRYSFDVVRDVGGPIFDGLVHDVMTLSFWMKFRFEHMSVCSSLLRRTGIYIEGDYSLLLSGLYVPTEEDELECSTLYLRAQALNQWTAQLEQFWGFPPRLKESDGSHLFLHLMTRGGSRGAEAALLLFERVAGATEARLCLQLSSLSASMFLVELAVNEGVFPPILFLEREAVSTARSLLELERLRRSELTAKHDSEVNEGNVPQERLSYPLSLLREAMSSFLGRSVLLSTLRTAVWLRTLIILIKGVKAKDLVKYEGACRTRRADLDPCIQAMEEALCSIDARIGK